MTPSAPVSIAARRAATASCSRGRSATATLCLPASARSAKSRSSTCSRAGGARAAPLFVVCGGGRAGRWGRSGGIEYGDRVLADALEQVEERLFDLFQGVR